MTRRSNRRLAGRILLAGVVFLCVIIGGGWAALNSEWVLRHLVSRLTAQTPGLQVEAVAGSVAGGIRLGRVVFRDGALTAELNSVHASVDLRSLAASALVLDSVVIAAASIDLGAAAPPRRRDRGPVPVLGLVRHLALERVTLTGFGRSMVTGPASGTLRLLNNHLELGEFAAAVGELQVTAAGSLTWAATTWAAGRLCVSGTAAGAPLSGCATLSGTLPALALTVTASAPLTLDGTGEIRLDNDLPLDLQVDWRDAGMPGYPGLASPAGTLTARGPLRSARVSGTAAVRVSGTDMDVGLEAILRPGRLEVERLRVASGAALAELTGWAALNGSEAVFTVSGQGIDPAPWYPQWPGRLDLEAELQISRVGALAISLTGIAGAGELRGRPGTVIGELHYSAGRFRADGIQFVPRSLP